MELSLRSLLVVVVVVVAGTVTEAAPRSAYGDDSSARSWPFLPYMPSIYNSPSLFPSSSDDFLGSLGDYQESSLRKSMIEDFNRRVFDAQRRCQDEFMMLRRLLEEQGNPLRGPTLDTPWYFPVFRFPYVPESVESLEKETEEEEEEEKKESKKKKKPAKSEEEEEEEEEGSEGSDSEEPSLMEDIDSILQNSPTPGDEWQDIPLLSEVPNADDLPDQYDNSTHTVHIINGSRLEVNTTTYKDTGDVVTTFYHTEVVNIVPEETESEEDEDATDMPVMEGETEGEDEAEEETKAERSDKPAEEAETHSDGAAVNIPAELKDLFTQVNPERKMSLGVTSNSINYNRPTRNATDSATATERKSPQQLAAYVKGSRHSKGKGKDTTATTRDLSGDTLVNKLHEDKKGGKRKEPDAEIISEEDLE